MAWEVRKLLEKVEATRGPAAAEALRGPANTIGHRLWGIGYHYREAERVLKEAVADDDQATDSMRAIRGMLGMDEEREYHVAVWAAEAHVNAAASALHTLGDVMAKVMWEALDLEPKLGTVLTIKNRYLKRVTKKMKDVCIAPTVTREAGALLQHPTWRQLSEFVNTSKHHSMIDMRPTLEFQKMPKHGLKILPFQSFPSEWSSSFLERTHRAVEDRIIAIGVAVNNAVGV